MIIAGIILAGDLWRLVLDQAGFELMLDELHFDFFFDLARPTSITDYLLPFFISISWLLPLFSMFLLQANNLHPVAS